MRIEIGTALGRGIPVVPVLVGGAAMPTAAELPAALEGLAHCLPFRLLDARWGDDVERLIGELASAGVRRAVPVITPDNADQLGVARAMTGHTAGVSSVAFSPDGYLLASGGGHRRSRPSAAWRTANGSRTWATPRSGCGASATVPSWATSTRMRAA